MAQVFGFAASAVCLILTILLPGFGVVCLAERVSHKRALRSLHLAWLAGCAAAAPLFYVTERLPAAGAGVAIIVAIVFGIAGIALSRKFRGRLALDQAVVPGKWALAFIAIAAVTLAAPYLEFTTGSDIYANVVRDWNPRQAMIWSIRQYGLPLQDSLFYPGKSLPMYYSLGAYPAVAAASAIGGESAPDGWPYTIFTTFTFVAFCLLVADVAGRVFASRRAATWAVILIFAGGMDVLVNAALLASGHTVSLGHVGAWANARLLRIDGLYLCALWAPPHLAAAGAGLMLTRWMPLNVIRRPGGCVGAGFLLAGMFYQSPYVTVAVGTVICASLVLQLLRRRWRRLRTHVLSLACCALLAVVLTGIYIFDLQAADLSGGRAKLALTLPAASITPLSWLVPGPVGACLDLAVQLALELSPLLVLGLLGYLRARGAGRWRYHRNLLALSIPVVLILLLFCRSTGRVNDWAVRVTHVLQISCVILGGGLMAGAARWRPVKRIAAYVFIAAGVSAAGWNMASPNIGRFVVTTPQQRLQLYQAASFIDENTPPDAIVMFDLKIDGISYARRWCNRRSLLANLMHGSFVYTDQTALKEVRSACQAVRNNKLGPAEIAALRKFGATVALVPTELLSSGEQQAGRVLYKNDAFAVVDLEASDGDG